MRAHSVVLRIGIEMEISFKEKFEEKSKKIDELETEIKGISEKIQKKKEDFLRVKEENDLAKNKADVTLGDDGASKKDVEEK